MNATIFLNSDKKGVSMIGNKNSDMSEFNTEVESVKGVNEFMPGVSNVIPDSQYSYDEFNEKKKPEKAAAVISGLFSFAAILAIITTLLLPSMTVKADFISVSSTDTTIAYEIVVDDLNENSDVTVVVYNDFVRFVAAVDSSAANGEFTGLKPNYRYTIAIMDGNKTIKKQTVYTKNSI